MERRGKRESSIEYAELEKPSMKGKKRTIKKDRKKQGRRNRPCLENVLIGIEREKEWII